MTRTLIDTNDDLLARAQELLGTSTKKDTINAALAQVVALAAGRDLLEAARNGIFADALDPDVMGQAWRR
jgi:Arc/MetJ family transcription regulator